MKRLVFDIETNGLLDQLSVIHCICTHDLDSGTSDLFGPDDIDAGLDQLSEADELIGHNIIGFDVPAILKLYPEFICKKLTDTLLISRVMYPDLFDKDMGYTVRNNPDYPPQLRGSHGLKAWGLRLGEWKGDYGETMGNPWLEYTEEMGEYCEQDVVVSTHLYQRLMSKKPSPQSIQLEHDVALIIRRQEEYGFAFDTKRAVELYGLLSGKHDDLRRSLASVFPPWTVKTPFTPKRDNKTLGYKKGVTIDKCKEVEFNPDSRDHIAQKLIERYGWKPTTFTKEGRAKIDETVLSGLEYPEAKLLSEYLMLTKRLGQISAGPQAWLKVEKAGRIFGKVNTNGAVTGRMTHSKPNVAQVPSGTALYGPECRALFTATPGKVLVGCDADGLEARCLAGYMRDKKFIEMILKGNKDEGSDLHTHNSRVLGCSRDVAKTFLYAFLYGAGVAKLGSILSVGPAKGRQARDRFLKGLPALLNLTAQVQRTASARGYLRGLDGRRLPIRSEHSALNTLLQSAGAIIMKRALVLLDEDLQHQQYVPGVDYEFVANVHDEWQIECKEGYEHDIGQRACKAMEEAGTYYDFGCPLAGNYATGNTWADTH